MSILWRLKQTSIRSRLGFRLGKRARVPGLLESSLKVRQRCGVYLETNEATSRADFILILKLKNGKLPKRHPQEELKMLSSEKPGNT